MNAIGYFVEGARSAGEDRSVGQQHQSFLDFCTLNGHEVVATFFDTADTEGEGFQQLTHFLDREDRGLAIVVVDSVGALGKDLGRAAVRLLTIEAHGVQVFEATTGADAARRIVDAWADRSEGTPVSERVRSAMRRKAVRGEALGRPPYGYRIGPRRKFEVVPEEAMVVKYIFRLYLQEGLGIRRIAGQLNEDGLLTRRGGRWSMVTVRDILRNRVYLGTYARFGVRVPDSHPALVTQDDIRRVQEKMQSRKSGGGTRTVEPFLLSGLVYCGRCENRMIGVSRRQKWKTKDGQEKAAVYRYYQCESRTNQNSCKYNTQRAPDLEERVRALVAADASSGVTRMRRTPGVDSYATELEGQLHRLEGRARRNRRQVEEIVADAAHGHINLARMRSLGSEVAAEQQRLEGEQAAVRDRLQVHHSEAERAAHLEETRTKLSRDWETLTFQQRQEQLLAIVDRIEVTDDDIRLFLRP